MMRRCKCRLAAFLWLCVVAVPAFGLDVPLTYERYPDDEDDPQASGGTFFGGERKAPPPGDWKFPAFVGPEQMYYPIPLGSREHLLVLDRQKADDSFFNRLYFDANANRDPTDDPVVDGTTERAYRYTTATFPVLDINVELDGQPFPYCIALEVQRHVPGLLERVAGFLIGEQMDAFGVALSVRCAYSGAFEAGGQSYRLWLADANANGRFDDRVTGRYDDRRARRETDLLRLTSEGTEPVSQPLAHRLFLNGNLFDVNIDIPAKKVVLNPVTEELVSLSVKTPFDRLTLYDLGRDKSVMVYRSGDSIVLPEGQYRLVGYDAYREDEQGDRWQVSGNGVPGVAPVSIAKGQENVLPFGEPFVPRVSIAGWSLTGRNAYLGFVLEGSGQESVDVWHVSGDKTRIPLSSRNRNYPKEPTYKITKADGEIVAQGAFEYG